MKNFCFSNEFKKIFVHVWNIFCQISALMRFVRLRHKLWIYVPHSVQFLLSNMSKFPTFLKYFIAYFYFLFFLSFYFISCFIYGFLDFFSQFCFSVSDPFVFFFHFLFVCYFIILFPFNLILYSLVFRFLFSFSFFLQSTN